MAHTRTLFSSCVAGDRTLSGSLTINASGAKSLSEDIPADSTDLAVALSIDVSALKMLFMVSDVDLTVTFVGPDAEFILDAGTPVTWNYLSGLDNPFGSTDVTSITVTNETDDEAVLDIEILTDATP